MSIDPTQFTPNQAWLLFQLNDHPMRVAAEGNFNAMCMMELNSGVILGMELIPVSEPALPEFSARKLLISAQGKAGARPEFLYIASEQVADDLVRQATAMGITVRREPAKALAPITREAREGFSAHLRGGSS